MKRLFSSKILLIPVLLIGLLLVSSCQMGKWQAEGKFSCFEDGGADVVFRLYPMDNDANNSFGSVMEGIKNEEPKAVVSEKKEGKGRIIIVTKKLTPRQNIFLKKEDGKWRFRYHNQFFDNVTIRQLEVFMPGWITTTNANTRIGSYAKWDNIYEGSAMTAESLTVSAPSVIGMGFVIIVFLIVAVTVFFLIRREKKEKKKAVEKPESNDFDY